METTKVAVVGACVTRDCFNRSFVPFYRENFECVSTVWQSSFISLVSPPTKVADQELAGRLNDKQLAYLKEDIEKEHIRKLVAQKPDYIILDLYADTHYGTCLINGTPVTCNPNSLMKTNFYKLNKDNLTASNLLNSPEQFSKVKDAFYRFIELMQHSLPNARVILHLFEFTDAYINKKGESIKFEGSKYAYIEKANTLLNKFYAEVLKEREITTIDMRDRYYLGDEGYPFGLEPYHFERQYQLDFISKFSLICHKDKLSSGK
ncbi:DUF6270 domain-containing protein [Pseudomonas sp. Irchel s3h17]|uniref:DUF6270 domain-containing protein n=1 Tax=Pseudomonas sp. Irchel s3h17 TaxID=2009182 RepID=UPI000BA33670|nr:DUF6270 domain-containing protein [Pseudomonas sp. Irchel s3h17]